ncbi:uncharacterized protein LOC131290822 [Anopheles ziemanni]|uniref:uncharacterized protein LOC131269435 n=1 Tax=Anopheles coustani TaxID=139045 RepID=UPI00265A383B|nr:uncharacterized protein LOC131269435 [Anopheles coustani]XP_058175986.1 uncharacterized protein LOC131290822 [Anopheles ziemanni]
MAQQKFFSGLTEGMINRSAGERPDRQKTHFFWPDEYAPDVEAPKRKENAPNPPQRPINGKVHEHEQRDPDPAPATRGHQQKNTASHIQFYDGVESSFGELERSKAHERRRIEQFLRQQSEEDTGEAARAKRLSTLQSKIEFYDYPPESVAAGEPRVIIHRFGGSARSVQESPPRSRAASRQDIDTTYQDEEFEFDDRSSIRSSASSYAPSCYRRTSHVSDLPEHKRNSQRHLRSSINFHNGCTIADDSEAPRKTVSVRESATSRVGVGLPNL